MKRITTLVAAAASAVAMMAAFSAATASAGTVLCNEPVAECTSPAEVQPAGSYFNTGRVSGKPSGDFVLKAGGLTMLDCGTNYFTNRTTEKNGNPLPVETNNYMQTKTCVTIGGGTCTSATMSDPAATIETDLEGGGVIRIGSASEPLAVSFTCDQGWNQESSCTYEATDTVTMTVEYSSATINTAPMVRTAASAESWCFLQSPTLTVDNTTAPERSISSATETVLCDNYLEETSVCPNNEVLPAGSFLVGGGYTPDSFKVMYGSNALVTCDTTAMSFESLERSGSPLAADSYFNLHKPSCEVYGDSAGEKCSSLTLNGPPTTIESSGTATASIAVGTASQPLVLSFACNFGGGLIANCTYKASGPATLAVEGGTATAKEVGLTLTSSSGFCLGSAKMSMDNGLSGQSVIAPI